MTAGIPVDEVGSKGNRSCSFRAYASLAGSVCAISISGVVPPDSGSR